jgi:hypothetical protein
MGEGWPRGGWRGSWTDAVPGEGSGRMIVAPPERFVNGVTWAFAPDWLTVSQACEPAG